MEAFTETVTTHLWFFMSGMVVCMSYLIGAGSLVSSAGVFIMLLCLGLVCHTVGLVYRRHVVHQSNGLHRLVDSTADGLADLRGCWSPGGWKVMGGLKAIKDSTDFRIRDMGI